MAQNVVFDTYVDKTRQKFSYQNKQVQIKQGAKLRSITVTGGTLKIAGECEIGEIVVINPRLGKGECADGIWLGGVWGSIESISII